MPENDFSPDALRVPRTTLDVTPPRPPRRLPRHRPGELFLKGPIPWGWLRIAMVLPGAALHVALLLWMEAGCRKSRTVRFRLGRGREVGLSLNTTRRGVRALEEAGLVSIHASPGQSLEVTLLDAGPKATG